MPDSSWLSSSTPVPVKVPSHSDVPYSPVGHPEEHGTLLSQIVPAASQRSASRRSVSGKRGGAEEEQAAVNSVRASDFANVMAGISSTIPLSLACIQACPPGIRSDAVHSTPGPLTRCLVRAWLFFTFLPTYLPREPRAHGSRGLSRE